MVLNFLIFCNNIFYNYWKKISSLLRLFQEDVYRTNHELSAGRPHRCGARDRGKVHSGNHRLNCQITEETQQAHRSSVNRFPSRGQRKNIKFSRPAAKRCWPLLCGETKCVLFRRRQDTQIALHPSGVVIMDIFLDHLDKLMFAGKPSAVIAFPFQNAPETLQLLYFTVERISLVRQMRSTRLSLTWIPQSWRRSSLSRR